MYNCHSGSNLNLERRFIIMAEAIVVSLIWKLNKYGGGYLRARQLQQKIENMRAEIEGCNNQRKKKQMRSALAELEQAVDTEDDDTAWAMVKALENIIDFAA